MVDLLNTIGSTIKFDKKTKKIEIHNQKPLKTFAPYYLLKTMRAGVLVLGSLLAKKKSSFPCHHQESQLDYEQTFLFYDPLSCFEENYMFLSFLIYLQSPP